MDCSPPGSSVHEILQARIPKWVAISFSRGIFLTPGSNSCLPYCRQILYHLTHQGSPLYTYDISAFFFFGQTLIIAILSGVRWYFIVVLIWISLMVNYVEQLFICLLAICHLWKNVYSSRLIFWLDFFGRSVVWTIYIFCILAFW